MVSLRSISLAFILASSQVANACVVTADHAISIGNIFIGTDHAAVDLSRHIACHTFEGSAGIIFKPASICITDKTPQQFAVAAIPTIKPFVYAVPLEPELEKIFRDHATCPSV